MDRAGLDDLLPRACRRDPEALGRLVELYSPRVFGLLYRLTGSRDAAEELLQETFLRVVRTIDQYEHVGRFEPWLFRIAANLARDRARKMGRYGEAASLDTLSQDGEWPESGVVASRAAAPEQRLSREEAGQQLAAGLERLSHVEREIILLRHFSELPFREIAEILNIPLGTALARAHRALKHLREVLGDEES